MDRDADNVGQASRLPVRATSLRPKCSAGKDARRIGSQGWLRYARTIHG